MEKHTEQLSEQVKDALTELGNIGAGNATTSLSVLLSSKLSMSAPTVKLYDFNELENALGGPETSVVGVLSRLHGSFNAMILFVLGLDDARHLSEVLLGQTQDWHSEMGNVCDWRNREHPDRFVRCIVREPVRDGAKVLPAADLY
mgnify:CR=1 FL=1